MGPYVASVPSRLLNQASTVTFKRGPGTGVVASVKSKEGRKSERRSALVAILEEIIVWVGWLRGYICIYTHIYI